MSPKMTQRNIAIVLAPTLLRPGDKGPKPEDSECIIDIVDTLIQESGRGRQSIYSRKLSRKCCPVQ